jgi:hypothetical protein
MKYLKKFENFDPSKEECTCPECSGGCPSDGSCYPEEQSDDNSLLAPQFFLDEDNTDTCSTCGSNCSNGECTCVDCDCPACASCIGNAHEEDDFEDNLEEDEDEYENQDDISGSYSPEDEDESDYSDRETAIGNFNTFEKKKYNFEKKGKKEDKKEDKKSSKKEEKGDKKPKSKKQAAFFKKMGWK